MIPPPMRPQRQIAVRRTVLAVTHRLFGRSPARRHDGPDNVLVMAFEKELGSAMAVTPLLAALRQALPDTVVTLAGPAMMAEVAAHNPHVDRIVILPNPHHRPARALWAARRLRAADGGGFDWLLSTAAARRFRYALTAALVPAGRRAGLGLAEALADYDGPVAYDLSVAMQANNLRVLSALGADALAVREPEIYFPPSSSGQVRDLLRTAAVDPDRPVMVLAAQTSGGQPTAWFPDRFAQMADRLADAWGLQVVFVGTQAGAALIDDIRGRMQRPATSLAGKTDIASLAALFAGADLAVALDSGAMHVARGTRVPLVVIASGWQEPHHWLPQGVVTCRILSGAGEWCRSCTRFSCPQRTCMMRINADDVVTAATDLFQHFPPSPSARAARMAACTTGRRS